MRNLSQIAWAVIIILLLSLTSVFAADWEKLGARKVQHKADRDVILVGAKEGTFTAIKLVVRKAGIHLMDMKVHFVNGDVMDVKVRKLIPKNGETRVIDLPGKDRKIEKVVFWYETPKKRAKLGTVRLWGRH